MKKIILIAILLVIIVIAFVMLYKWTKDKAKADLEADQPAKTGIGWIDMIRTIKG